MGKKYSYNINMANNNDIEDELNLRETRGTGLARRGRLSQLMIFLNGFILTITAFISLMVFMEQVQTSKTQTIHETIMSELKNTIQQMSDNLLLVPLAQNGTEQQKQFIIDKISKSFSNVYKAYKHSDGRWSIQKVLQNEHDVALNRVLKTIEDLHEARVGDVKFFASSDADSHMMVSAKISPQLYIIGHVNHNMFQNLIESDNSLYKMRIFDNQTGANLFSQTNPHVSDVKGYKDLSQIIQVLNVGSNNLTISTDIVRDPYYVFIAKLPYLLLLFGGTLTIIGTLYVRNNQKQAYQLEVMNNLLENKNTNLVKNIDDSKRLYKELEKKEADYQAVLDTVQDILFEIDELGHIYFINAAWETMTGVSTEDAIDRNIFDFIDQNDLPKIMSVFEQFLEDDREVCIETKIYDNHQAKCAVEFVLSTKHTDFKDDLRIIGTMKDIADKQRAELALSEVEKKYRTIVENAAGGIYQITPDGRIMNGNPALAHILGFNSLEELLNSDFNMNKAFVSSNDRKKYEISLNKNGFVRNHEAEIRCLNGQKIWVNENARCVRDIDGAVLYYEGSIEDITQRKTAETALIQEKLNSDLASRAKSEFLANMSHELRTPLNAIIGFSEIIKGEALGTIENKLYVDYAKDIYDSGGRLLNVINEILGISKIEAGERQLNESVVDLGNVIETCLNLLMSKIENHQLEISNIIDEHTPPIIAEELAFKQIFMNLLSNAIKFTPANGTITISSEYTQGGDLRLSVTDTGVGIDEADIPKALSPFGQLDNALSRSNSGTGLGLTLVSSLLRLHGGKLEMISQKNIGTTVTIVIPAKRVAVKKISNVDAKTSSNVASINDYKNK